MVGQFWSNLLVPVAKKALITLDIDKLAAGTITFRFKGKRIKGSYKIVDEIYKLWFSAAANPHFNEYGSANAVISKVGAITDFKLFVDGVQVNYASSLNISEFFATSTDFAHTPEHNHYYWEIRTRKGYEKQRPSEEDYRRNNLTGVWGNFVLTIEDRGGRVKDNLARGKVCSAKVSISDPFVNIHSALKGNVVLTETVKHYIN